MVEKTFAELTGNKRIAYGNKLICEFIERKTPQWLNNNRYISLQEEYFYTRSYCRNWSALMKVWDKILLGDKVTGFMRKYNTALSWVTDNPYTRFMTYSIGSGDAFTGHLKEESRIMATWACCVYFIEWHNKHQNG